MSLDSELMPEYLAINQEINDYYKNFSDIFISSTTDLIGKHFDKKSETEIFSLLVNNNLINHTYDTFKNGLSRSLHLYLTQHPHKNKILETVFSYAHQLVTHHLMFSRSEIPDFLGQNSIKELEKKFALLQKIIATHNKIREYTTGKKIGAKQDNYFSQRTLNRIQKLNKLYNQDAQKRRQNILERQKQITTQLAQRTKNIHVAMWTPDKKFHSLILFDKLDIIAQEFRKAYTTMESRYKYLYPNGDFKTSGDTFIFLCPEWTFLNERNRSENQCYSKIWLKALKKRFLSLAQEYPNALIIPGTIRIRKEFKEKNKQKYVDQFRTENKNIDLSQYTTDFLWKGISTVCHTKNKALIFFDDQCLQYDKKHYGDDVNTTSTAHNKFYPGTRSGKFHFNGHDFFLQICADHATDDLKSQNAENTDIQIVLSNIVHPHFANVTQKNDKRTIFINCAGNFIEREQHAECAGVWVKDPHHEFTKVQENLSAPDRMNLYTFIGINTPAELIKTNEAQHQKIENSGAPIPKFVV